MAVTVSEVNKLTSITNQNKAAPVGNWKLIEGDLEELLKNNKSEGVVLFEKDIKIEADKKSTAETSDNKTSAEAKQLKPLQIVLRRCEAKTIDLSKPDRPHIPTGEMPVCVFVLFGKETKRTAKVDFPNIYENGLLSEKLRESEHPLWNECFLSHDFFTYSTTGYDKTSTQLQKLVGAKDRFATDSYLGLVVGSMRASWLPQLINLLRDQEIISLEDCQFLKNIIPPRTPSAKETDLEAQLKVALEAKKYREAVGIARKLHALSREEAKARGSRSTSGRKGEPSKLIFLDDSDAALRLAEALEPVSAPDAIDALEILTEYENQEAFDAWYNCPAAKKAFAKMAEIRTGMLGGGTHTLGGVDVVEERKIRKLAIEAMLMNLGTSGDIEKQYDDFRQLIHTVETHCGNDTVDLSQSMFRTIDRATFAEKGLRVMLDMMLIMMDEIFKLRQKITTPVVTTAADADVKHKSELQAVQQQQQQQQPSQHSQAAPLSTSTTAPQGAPVTYGRDAEKRKTKPTTVTTSSSSDLSSDKGNSLYNRYLGGHL